MRKCALAQRAEICEPRASIAAPGGRWRGAEDVRPVSGEAESKGRSRASSLLGSARQRSTWASCVSAECLVGLSGKNMSAVDYN